MTRATTIWILLGIAVILLLAFSAFGGDRAAREAGDVMKETATSTTGAFESASVRAEAATELAALRARAEAGETYAELSDDFAAIRTRTAAAYENAEGATSEEWSQLRTDFDSFEASARTGTGSFLDSISTLISRISADVRVETRGE